MERRAETNSILSRLSSEYCQGFYRSLAIGDGARDRETNKFPPPVRLSLIMDVSFFLYILCFPFYKKKGPMGNIIVRVNLDEIGFRC